jgi:hypothetical protein
MTSETPNLGLYDHGRMPTDDEQDPLKTPPASTTNGLPPDFDAGINTSAAWTESRDKGRSLSDEETDPNDPELYYLQVPGRPARALYTFEGKPEFREVCVNAGDEIEVIREEVGDGWSLVKLFVEGGVELGLLPRSYYTVGFDTYPISCTDVGLVHRGLYIPPIPWQKGGIHLLHHTTGISKTGSPPNCTPTHWGMVPKFPQKPHGRQELEPIFKFRHERGGGMGFKRRPGGQDSPSGPSPVDQRARRGSRNDLVQVRRRRRGYALCGRGAFVEGQGPIFPHPSPLSGKADIPSHRFIHRLQRNVALPTARFWGRPRGPIAPCDSTASVFSFRCPPHCSVTPPPWNRSTVSP